MAFSTQHLYVTFGGGLPGAEAWQCGIRTAVPSGAVYGPTYDHGDFPAVADAVEDWFTSGDAGISPRATLEWVKEAVIGTDGSYVAAPAIREISPPLVGASSASGGVVPNQIALVVTLLTGTSFGDAQRGRFYMPMPAVIVGTDGRITLAEAQDRADAAAVLIQGMNAARTGVSAEEVVVMSQKGLGTTRAVTEVSVGTVLDTHRSRRESLIEERSTATI